MKYQHRLIYSFEKDLNQSKSECIFLRRSIQLLNQQLNQVQLETPPQRSMIANYEILIKTKNYLDQVFYQKIEKCSIHTQTILTSNVTDMKSLVQDAERNLRSRTIDHFPLDLKIDSQLRSIAEKKIKIKNCSQSKLNKGETQYTQTTTRGESKSSFFKKGILKNQSSQDELQTSQKRSISAHSGKRVRFSLTNHNVRLLMMFGK